MTSFVEMMARNPGLSVRKTGGSMLFHQALAEQYRRSAKAAATLTVAKATADDEQRVVRGWASVSTKGGTPVVDVQGDTIATEELHRAARDFLTGPRSSLRSHSGKQIGEVVESAVLDAEMQKALGIDLGMEGWLVAIHVTDDATWAEVRKGALMSFSIGGSAVAEQ